MNGSVISYEQAIWHPFGRIETSYTYYSFFDGNLKFNLFLTVHPYNWADTNDTHFLRNIHFYDTLRGGLGLDIGFSISKFPKKDNGLGFTINISQSTLTRITGTTASNNTGVYSGPLTIDEGFSAKMESIQYYISLGIIIPVFGH